MSFLSATEIVAQLRAKKTSPLEILEAQIKRIEEVNPRVNAFVTTDFDRAREAARDSEARIMKGEARALEGLPVSIKDTIDTAGLRTVSGTRLHEQRVPNADATVVSRLKAAGAVILGKTNVPECAMDLRTDNPVFGRTNNPWDLERTAGGSSGGEAAAIAAGCSPAGVGSDLGGSIRVPAHFCGICGLKPTPGRVPGTGHFVGGFIGPISLGTSIGPMARRVADLELLFKVLAGFDPADPVSVPLPVRERPDIQSLKLMWYADDGFCPATTAVRQTVERAAGALAARGLDIVERRPKGLERGWNLWSVMLGQAGTPALLRLYEGREDLMGPLLKAMKKISKPLSFDEYTAAWIARDLLRASILREMQERPVLLSPVAAIPAFPHDHRGGFDVEGRSVEYLHVFSYAQTYNVLGLPAAVVPCGRSPEGLPIGVQVVGFPYAEETVLAVAALLEESLGGFQPPPLL